MEFVKFILGCTIHSQTQLKLLEGGDLMLNIVETWPPLAGLSSPQEV